MRYLVKMQYIKEFEAVIEAKDEYEVEEFMKNTTPYEAAKMADNLSMLNDYYKDEIIKEIADDDADYYTDIKLD